MVSLFPDCGNWKRKQSNILETRYFDRFSMLKNDYFDEQTVLLGKWTSGNPCLWRIYEENGKKHIAYTIAIVNNQKAIKISLK